MELQITAQCRNNRTANRARSNSLGRSFRVVAALSAAAGLLALAALPSLVGDRFMPTAHAAGFTWTGAVSSDWFTPGNWSPAGVPGAHDMATINSGTVDIAVDATVAALNFGGGTLTGAGALTVTSAFSWTAGSMQGSGATVIAASATLNISTENTKILDGRRLDNHGTINVGGVGQRIGFCGTGFVIENAGTINLGDGGNFTSCNGPLGTINNSGTLRKSAGADATLLEHNLNNNGTVDVLSGELRVGYIHADLFNSSGGGAFNVATGATLNFSRGTHLLTAGSSVGGAGTVTFSDGTMNVNGFYSVGSTAIGGGILSGVVNFNSAATTKSLNFTSGRLAGSGMLTITSTLNWTGGQMQGGGTTVLAAGATASVSSTPLKTLEGGRTFNNDGTVNIVGTGQVQGFCGTDFIINNVGTMHFGAGGNFTSCNGPLGTINNTGTLRKSAGADVTLVQQNLNNNGAVEVQTGALQLGGGGTSAGAFTVLQGATLRFLPFNVSHTLTGASSVGGAGNVTFSDGTVNVNGSYDVGSTTIDSGILSVANFNSAATTQSLSLVSSSTNVGALGGTGTLTVTGTLDWRGGKMQGGGATVIAAGATASLSSASHKILEGGRILDNAGTLNLDVVGDSLAFCGGNFTLNNSGTLNIRGDGSIGSCNGSPGTINNTGVLRKSAGTGVSNVRHSFNNHGTVEVTTGVLNFPNSYKQAAGVTRLDGGTLGLSPDFFPGTGTILLNGGALVGRGTIEGNVVNSGTVSPGLAPGAAGTLRVTGDYTQDVSGRLKIEIGGAAPGSQFDQLFLGTGALTKKATLGGTLDVQLVNGFSPAASDSFEVARYSSLASQFSQIDGLDIGNGRTFRPDYRTNNLVLISGAPDGETTGCGSPARPWVHYIAPRTVRLHNFAGGTLYRGTVLYGNTGGRGTFAVIRFSLDGLTDAHKVSVAGVSTSPLVPVSDPAMRRAFDDMPKVFRDRKTGKRVVPVIVYLPPDNPVCRAKDDPAGAGGGSFTVTVTVGGEGDGGDQSVCSLVPPEAKIIPDSCAVAASTADPAFSAVKSGEFASLQAAAVNPCAGEITAEVDVSECLDAIFGFLSNFIPGIDCLNAFKQGIDLLKDAAVTPSAVASFALSALQCAANFVPVGALVSAALNIIGEAGKAADALKAFQACGLLPGGSDGFLTLVVCSFDPNDKVGARGSGEAHFITGEAPIPYAIFFENKPDATAPAQEVIITDQLDTTKFDLSTFQLGAISFGDKIVVPPPARSEFNTEIDLRPGKNLIARINAKLDKSTGLLTWRFSSIDPATLQPTLDPLAGFLPPNRVPAEGEGSVLFTINPRQDLASGTQINNQARIVFDTNDPIDTPAWSNIIDYQKPSSRVESLPAVSNTASFTVSWSGSDADSGVSDFTVFVSEDGGPFQLWLRNTTQTSSVFQGQQGTSYGFYSLARDNTGNVEVSKLAAEATTVVNTDAGAPVTVAALSRPANAAGWHKGDVTVTLNASDIGSGVREVSYIATGAQSTTGETVAGASATLHITAEGTTEIIFFATDNTGNAEAAQTLVVKLDKTPPVISCRAPDGLWHAADVSIGCTAGDTVSGLADSADASFSLVTSVAPDTETANAVTDSRTVADQAGNSWTAGPVAGIRVDKKAPSISISSPQADNYVLNQSVSVGYMCSDGGSGVAADGCAGAVASGHQLDTSAIGKQVFTVQATDSVGNASTLSVNYAVTYGVRALYDQNKAYKAGSTIPIRLQLVDANGVNRSSEITAVTAVGTTLVSNYAPETAEDAGQANPDDNFRYTIFDVGGAYVYNLSTTRLVTGTYYLMFKVAGDTGTYSVQFIVR